VYVEGATDRELYLPEGTWVEWWRTMAYGEENGDFTLGAAVLHDGMQAITVSAPNPEIPMFVEAGAVIPMLSPDVFTLAEYGSDPEIIHASDRDHLLHVLAFPRGETAGSFYDDVGHVGRCPRVVKGIGPTMDGESRRVPNPGHAWWDEGRSRRRLSWQHHMGRPIALVYGGLDPDGTYVIRGTGQGTWKLRADGVLLTPTKEPKDIGAFKEYPVPRSLLKDLRLRLTWDRMDESHLNWRQHSHVGEVWLLKR